jgi:hypothetical protein
VLEVIVGLREAIFRDYISLSDSLKHEPEQEFMQQTVKAMNVNSTSTGSLLLIDSSSLRHNVSSLLFTTGSMRVIACREKYGFKAALRIR